MSGTTQPTTGEAARDVAQNWRSGWFGKNAIARRLMPLFLAAISLPWLVGFIELLLEQEGLRDAQAIAIQAGLATLIALGMLLWTLRALHWHEETRRRLHQAAFRLADLVHSSEDAIVGITAAGLVTSWNQGAQKIYGYSRDEMIGHSIFRLAHPQHRGEFEATFREVIDKKEPQRFEAAMPAKGGVPVYVSVVLSPLIAPDGKVTGASCICRDITGQKRAEEMFRWLLDSAPDAMVIVDHEGKIVLVNDQTEKLFGYSRQEMLGAPVEKLIPERYQAVHVDHRQGFSSNPRRRDMGLGTQLFAQRKDGTEFPAEINLSPFEFAGEVRVISAIRDLSERLKAETALLRAEAVVQLFPQIVWVTDSTGAVVYCNRYWYEYSGLTPQQTSGEGWTTILHPDDRPAVLEAWRRSFTTHTAYTIEYRLRRASDATYRWHVGQGSPIRNAKGEVINWVGIALDVHEKKMAEVAIRNSEDQLLSFIENAPYGILRTSNIEHGGRFVSVNRAIVDMLGYESSEEMLQLNLESDVYADVEERRLMLDLIQKQNSFRGLELHWKKKNGKLLTLRISGRIVREGDKEYIESIAEDITEQRQLEQQLRQVQKMEAIGQLAAGVAHDFNNLLGVILGYTNLSREKIDSSHPVAKYLSEIRQATQRAAALTRQLLAFARKQFLLPKIIDLNSVLSEMIVLLTHLVGKNIRVSLDLVSKVATIKADPGQIEQIVMNLVVNARDAMPKPGYVTISTHDVELDQTYSDTHLPIVPGAYVLLSVTDNGCGMDTETQAHLFEPFFSTKGPGKGTGLGLATVYGIVKQSGGYIWVYSKPGKGTTFKIYFPRVLEAAQPRPVQPPEPEVPKGTETILLVEDEPALRRLTGNLLRSAGYTVLTASDPDAAIHVAREHPGRIHLLLTDVDLLGISGVELSHKLREFLPDLKIILMSGYGGEVLTRHMAQTSEEALLEKPFSANALLAKVYAALHRPGQTNSFCAQIGE